MVFLLSTLAQLEALPNGETQLTVNMPDGEALTDAGAHFLTHVEDRLQRLELAGLLPDPGQGGELAHRCRRLRARWAAPPVEDDAQRRAELREYLRRADATDTREGAEDDGAEAPDLAAEAPPSADVAAPVLDLTGRGVEVPQDVARFAAAAAKGEGTNGLDRAAALALAATLEAAALSIREALAKE